jgi:hypothetical protein
LTYGKNDKIINVKSEPKDYTKLGKKMDNLVGGKTPWVDPSNLLLKFIKGLYVLEEGYDIVHIEVIVSNILRNSKDPKKPARLVEPYDPKLLSIKKLPGVISWPLGMLFEDITKAISTGLVSDRSPSSPIEKVGFGETLVDDNLKTRKV